MLCEKCGKMSATTHIRSVINGKVIEKHLCSHCAASEGYNDVKGSNLSQMLSSMFGDSLTNTSNTQLTRCSCCGSTFSDIAESGKCGCPECYTTFYEQFLPYIHKAQHGMKNHIGKSPNAMLFDKYGSIKELEDLLSRLVSEEKYERAAVIRDKIKLLKEENI